MSWAILDTGIYIGHWELRLYDVLPQIRKRFIVRHSAVVLSELRRGVQTPIAQKLVEELHRLASIQWAPTIADWWEAGRLIRKIGDAHDWESTKRREFQNDALIALTAYRHGATIVTDNLADFDLLSREVKFRLFPVKRTLSP